VGSPDRDQNHPQKSWTFICAIVNLARFHLGGYCLIKVNAHINLTGLLSTVMLFASSSIFAVSDAGMKACEMAVLQKSKFHDLPMAAVSVYPGKKENHAHFTVRWDGLKADGNCKVSGEILAVEFAIPVHPRTDSRITHAVISRTIIQKISTRNKCKRTSEIC
jgi:hypothetical protein